MPQDAEGREPGEAGYQGAGGDGGGQGGKKAGLFARMGQSIHQHPSWWAGGIAGATLLFTFLIWRQNQANNAAANNLVPPGTALTGGTAGTTGADTSQQSSDYNSLFAMLSGLATQLQTIITNQGGGGTQPVPPSQPVPPPAPTPPPAPPPSQPAPPPVPIGPQGPAAPPPDPSGGGGMLGASLFSRIRSAGEYPALPPIGPAPGPGGGDGGGNRQGGVSRSGGTRSGANLAGGTSGGGGVPPAQPVPPGRRVGGIRGAPPNGEQWMG